jgi:hypothetical protein
MAVARQLLYLKNVVSQDVDWVYLYLETNKWRVLVNTVIDIRVP